MCIYLGFPASPEVAPELLWSEETLLFSVRFSPPDNDQENPLTPVGIVYRIKDLNTQATQYLAQVTNEVAAIKLKG